MSDFDTFYLDNYILNLEYKLLVWGHRGHDRIVVVLTTTYMQSVPITTKVMSSNLVHGEMYSIQHYVIKFVSDLWQVGGFLRYSSFLHQ